MPALSSDKYFLTWPPVIKAVLSAGLIGVMILADATWGRTFWLLTVLVTVPLVVAAMQITLGRVTWAWWTMAAFGLTQDWMSVAPIGGHLAGALGAIVIVHLVQRRWLAKRSTAMVLFTVMILTASYYSLLWVWWSGWRWIDAGQIMPEMRPWLGVALAQVFLHPVWGWIWWRFSGRRAEFMTVSYAGQ